jgi:hypothetical protein
VQFSPFPPLTHTHFFPAYCFLLTVPFSSLIAQNPECFFIYNSSGSDSNNFNALLFWINAINDPIAFYFIASQALKLFLKGFSAVWIFENGNQAKSYVRFDYRMEFS